MGRQSSRIWLANNTDHKEMVTWTGTEFMYHDKAYIWNGSGFELVWEKLDDDFEGIATPIQGLVFGSEYPASPLAYSWMPHKMGDYFVGREYGDISNIVKIHSKTKEKTRIYTSQKYDYYDRDIIGFTDNQTIQIFKYSYWETNAYNIRTGDTLCENVRKPDYISTDFNYNASQIVGRNQIIYSPNQGITSKMLQINDYVYPSVGSLPEHPNIGMIYYVRTDGRYYKCIATDDPATDDPPSYVDMGDLSMYYPQAIIHSALSGDCLCIPIQNENQDGYSGVYRPVGLKDYNTIVAINKIKPEVTLYSIPSGSSPTAWQVPCPISEKIQLEGNSYYGSIQNYYYITGSGTHIIYRTDAKTLYFYNWETNKSIKLELPDGITFLSNKEPHCSISPDENLIAISQDILNTSGSWNSKAFHLYNRKRKKWYHFTISNLQPEYSLSDIELVSKDMIVAPTPNTAYQYQVYKLK